jgi:hypothetical protein
MPQYSLPLCLLLHPLLTGLDFSNLKVSLPEDPWEAVLGPNYASMGAGGPGTPLLSPNSSVRRTTRNSHGTKDFSSGAVGDAPAPASEHASASAAGVDSTGWRGEGCSACLGSKVDARSLE